MEADERVLGREIKSSAACSKPTDNAKLELEALTRRMTKGEEMAWRIFYDQYFDRLFRYLLVAANGDEDVARESLQAALVRIARHIKVFQREDVFWSWLTLLSRTAFADEKKKRRRYFFFLERFKRHSEIKGKEEADKKLHLLLNHHIALLPTDQQKLIEQKYTQRRTVREIADELQTTEKAVESQLSRIRKELKTAALKDLNHEARD